MKKKTNILAAFLAVMLCVSMLCGCRGNTAENAADPNISIPGYESLDFKAGQQKQSVNFYNPDNNGCYFRLSLIIGDETLWTSDYIKPGGRLRELTLAKPLTTGTYKAVLKYDCFTPDKKTQLNGAEVKLNIEVN